MSDVKINIDLEKMRKNMHALNMWFHFTRNNPRNRDRFYNELILGVGTENWEMLDDKIKAPWEEARKDFDKLYGLVKAWSFMKDSNEKGFNETVGEQIKEAKAVAAGKIIEKEIETIIKEQIEEKIRKVIEANAEKETETRIITEIEAKIMTEIEIENDIDITSDLKEGFISKIGKETKTKIIKERIKKAIEEELKKENIEINRNREERIKKVIEDRIKNENENNKEIEDKIKDEIVGIIKKEAQS